MTKTKQKPQTPVRSTRLVGLRPCDCESIADVFSLNASTESSGRWNMLIQHDGAVILTEQRRFERPTAEITIPRGTFQRLIEWYQTEQPNK